MRITKYFIGHSDSTYWRKKDSEKVEIIRKIEPYLIFLNIQSQRRDKVKDDAIAQLSDQLLSLSARLQEIERKQVLV
jgi:hypothetical protein